MTNPLPMPRYEWDTMVTDLFDLLSDNPEGVELATIAERLECDIRVARMAITKLRHELGEDSSVNVSVRSEGRSRKYQLVGEGTGDTAMVDAGYLQFNRKYIETRLASVRNIYTSLQRAAQTEREADRYRRLTKHLDRLIEDVADAENI